MEVFDFIDAVVHVGGWVVVLAGVIYALNGLYRRLRRPKIKLAFDPARTFHRRRDIDANGNLGGESIWIHVYARVSPRQTLSDCHAYLESVHEKGANGEWKPLSGFNTKLPLQWANTGGKERAEILPGESIGIDLGVKKPTKPQFFIATTQPGPTGTVKVLGAGEYLVTIICLAENARTGRITLRIVIDSRSREPEVEVYEGLL